MHSYTKTAQINASRDTPGHDMHEGKPKDAICAKRLLHPRYGNTERTMHMDPAFSQAPHSFRDYAIELWTQFEYEHLGGTKP